jgi:hypothetical protein
MAKVKLGWAEFDVDSEEIVANGCGVSAANVALLATRMKSGEISRLKTLYLVICHPVLLLLHIFRLLRVALPLG